MKGLEQIAADEAALAKRARDKRERCKHREFTDSLHARRGQRGAILLVHTRRCDDCGSQLPLGPASSDERSDIELHAAVIAQMRADGASRFHMNAVEEAGFDGRETLDIVVSMRCGAIRHDEGVPLNLDSANWRSGFLAAAIASHVGEEP